jgi:hypothetical protein
LLRACLTFCRAAFVALVLVCSARAAAAQTPDSTSDDFVPASECCLELLLPVGARSVAMGQALVTSGDPESLFVNPAGLAWLHRGVFTVHHGTNQQAQMDALTVLFTPKRIGTIGLTYHLFDYGATDATDINGLPIGTLSTRAQMLVLSYATYVVPTISAGVNYRLYNFRSDCAGSCSEFQFSGTTQGLDAGVQYRSVSARGLRAGASLDNVGFALQIVNADQSDPPPLRLRLGASYEVLHHFRPDTTLALRVAVQSDVKVRNGSGVVPSVGVELSVNQAIFLMAGYRGGEGLNTGLAVGVGLRYERFEVAVAKAFSSSSLDTQTEPLQLTFAVGF